jgi:hypothetical protein
VIRPRNSRCMPQLAGVIPWLSHPPARQPGDMACLESDLNHLSPLLPRCQLEAERAGILMDAHVRPGQLSLLLRSPAMVAIWMACVRDPLGSCYLYQGGDLDFLQGGDCEKKQGRDLDFLPRVRLREQTGEKLGYHTGGKPGRTYRIEAWTSYRREDCEYKQGRDWDISQRVDLRRIPGCHVNPNGPPRAR